MGKRHKEAFQEDKNKRYAIIFLKVIQPPK